MIIELYSLMVLDPDIMGNKKLHWNKLKPEEPEYSSKPPVVHINPELVVIHEGVANEVIIACKILIFKLFQKYFKISFTFHNYKYEFLG